MDKKTVKRAKMGSNNAITLQNVSAYIASLAVFRRLQRTYRFNHVSPSFMFLLAYNGCMTPKRLTMEYYGYDSGYNYRSTHFVLSTLRDAGLAESVGGKWRLTEKGLRELGLID